jgi:hypothetical protein
MAFHLCFRICHRKVQANQEGLKLNGTHIFVYAADDILNRSIHTIRKNTEALVIDSKEIGLEVNDEKTKVMSRDQNEGQNGNILIGNKLLETVEEFEYLGTTLTNQNSINKEIKSRLKSGNACYHSVQNLLSSSLLSKSVKIYRTIILPVVLYGCESWSLTLREESRLRVFESKVLRRIFGPKRDEVTGEWGRLHNKELYAWYSSPDIIRVIKSRRQMCRTCSTYGEVLTGLQWGNLREGNHLKDPGVDGMIILK